ncbi:hypothetical protein ACH5A3_33005 [Streptomyces echinatus]
MRFTVLLVPGRPGSPVPRQAFPVRNDWNDYTLKTTFLLLCVDPGGET